MEAYRIENLTFTYPGHSRPILNNVSLTVEQGQFVTLCGPSGCGKTTLLRQLKTVLAPHGEKSGAIYFEGNLLDDIDQKEQSARIGFVLQSPDNQIVTDKVWHELAFGLESLGYDTPTIRLRVAEMASFFGIQTWFYKNVTELSGGQKQLLNLAAIMAMQPTMLILDEPTSQLDPIAASDFLATVGKINRELGTTILMTEHRLEDVLPLSDRVVVMDSGSVIADGSPQEVGELLKDQHHSMFMAMPAPMRIYAGVDSELPCPITVRDGRNWLEAHSAKHPVRQLERENNGPKNTETVIEMDDVWFRYGKDLPDVVKGLSLNIRRGEFFALVGGNGTGKTTTMSLISGINTPYRGEVRLEGRALSAVGDKEKFAGGMLGVLPQNPQALFVKKTVELDLYEMLSGAKISAEEKKRKVAAVSRLCELDYLLESHPYDLSGGEQQRAALAKVLLLEPRILLLDEPTKGMDAYFKAKFAGIMKRLQAAGTTILMISHDIEFCASYADRCAMFFDGSIVTSGPPVEFFSGNSFYTTSANRMARRYLPRAVSVDDVVAGLGGQVQHEEFLPAEGIYRSPDVKQEDIEEKPIAKWRKPAAFGLLGVCVLMIMMMLDMLPGVQMGDLIGGSLPDGMVWRYVLGVLLMTGSAIGALALLFYRKRPEDELDNAVMQVPLGERKLAKRTLVAAGLILLAIPLTLFIGYYYLDDRKYYFISTLIMLETMLPFLMVFESRKPQARELMVIAVLVAIAVAGRAAFFMLPQFKPVVALTIIAGIAFGGEAGFLVGAMTGFVSNFFFGQGPWTPWQMCSFGIIGFLAGVFFRKGLLRRSRIALCVFGAMVTFFVYGGIMNGAHVLIYQNDPKFALLLATYLAGIPFDLIHAVATVFFLYVASQPMLDKLDRIKMKYGMLEYRDRPGVRINKDTASDSPENEQG